MTQAITEANVKAVVIKTLAATVVSKPTATTQELAKMTGLSPFQVREALKRDDFKVELAKASDEVCSAAKNRLRLQLTEIVDECMRVIRERLATNDLEAVKVALKTLGLEQEDKKSADTTLQVFLPGSRPVKDIEHVDNGSS